MRSLERLFSLIVVCFVFFASCKENEKNVYETIRLSTDWQLFPSGTTEPEGSFLSKNMDQDITYYKAAVPSTVMGTLTENGKYKDIFINNNIAEVDRTQFDRSWWYRTSFEMPSHSQDQHTFLLFEGISYYANIWLNGTLIASQDSIYGSFRRFELDITDYIQEKNILAVEVFRAQPGDPNIGFADWNPRPSDENMGIFRPVSVITTGEVRMKNTVVRSKVNTQTLDEAWLTIESEIENLSDNDIKGLINGDIGDGISFSFPLELSAHEKRKVTLTSKEIPELHITNPRLWWCNNLGEPELYDLDISFHKNDTVTCRDTVAFGIREIESLLTAEGHREFRLNGQKVLLKSAGWTDDIFLRDTPESNEQQIRMVKDMNLNMIRFEGFWGNSSNVYDLCDRYGLMAIIGWSCHWEWEAYFGKPCSEEFGCIQSQEDIELISKSFSDQVIWLRNHPSIIAWMPGSDMLPVPELEEKYLAFLKAEDDRPYIGAAKMRKSVLSGITGTKMAGPYEYVGPNYWYIDKHYGGAFGFNTETGTGAQLPVIESLRKFIPEDKLWPIGNEYSLHCTTSSTAMNNLDVLTEVINNKYGEADNLEDFLQKADLLNYDGTRAMFEAFRVNLTNTTGIVQWMLNSAWPSLYWQLYDYYQIPTSGYYGTKKANNVLQMIYNYGDNSISAVNESRVDAENYKATIKIYDLKSNLINEQVIKVNLKSNTAGKILKLDPIFQPVFISMELHNSSNEKVADNFYCISDVVDEYDWERTNWVHTPIKKYSDFKVLSQLPYRNLQYSLKKEEKNNISRFIIRLKNDSPSISFFNMLKLKDEQGNLIPSALWSDNYISFEPQQEKEIVCTVENKYLQDKTVLIEIKGWNGEIYNIQ